MGKPCQFLIIRMKKMMENYWDKQLNKFHPTAECKAGCYQPGISRKL
jgi:hypothetical protein